MSKTIQHTFELPINLDGQRLDKAVATLLPDYSRARLQTWIKHQAITINGTSARTRDSVKTGDVITINAILEDEHPWQAEALPLNIVHHDADIIIINKDANTVVHPAAGNYQGTLANALLHHFPELSQLPRAGIVHRLDKNTTGLLVVARNLCAHHALVKQLQQRTLGREYQAIVTGILTAGGTIDAAIGRHPRNHKKMAVTPGGKPAITHYRILQRFDKHTHIKVKLETGRTHQIRVHMANIHHPLVGDRTYRPGSQQVANISELLRQTLQSFPRQALHAWRLTLMHPGTGQEFSWDSPLPDDMNNLLSALRT